MIACPPNAVPGGRDVEAFYGSMRVYRWGPEAGEKVLFVHGDATPSLVFSKIAQGLVDAGYRVMLFGKQHGWIEARGIFLHPNNEEESRSTTLANRLHRW